LLILISFNLIEKISATNPVNFWVKPNDIKMNWTSSPPFTAMINVTNEDVLKIKVLILNSSNSIKPNYTQRITTNYPTSCLGTPFELIVENETGSFNNESRILSPGESTHFKLHANYHCPPGRYFGSLNVTDENKTETHELKVTIDIPIDSHNEFSSTSGVGSFNGVMRKSSTFYHSFFFNSSLVENATFITVTLKNFTEDLDLFIFDDSLAAESIRNEDHPEEIVKKLEPNTIYEIRVYGNTSSNQSYDGSISFSTLKLFNGSEEVETLDFGKMGGDHSKTFNFILKNVGTLSFENIEGYAEIYEVLEFYSNKSVSFNVSSVVSKISVELAWLDGDYDLQLYSPSKVFNSSLKKFNTFIPTSIKKEFIETSDIEKGSWKVKVVNHSIDVDFNLTIKLFFKPENWFNFTFEPFDLDGGEEKNVSFVLKPQKSEYQGTFEGSIFFNSSSNSKIKIPFNLKVLNADLILNNSHSNPPPFEFLGVAETPLTIRRSLLLKNNGSSTAHISFIKVDPRSDGSSLNLTVDGIPEYLNAGESTLINFSIKISENDNPGIYKGWFSIHS